MGRTVFVIIVALMTAFGGVVRAAEPAAVKHYILIDLKPGADQLLLDRWYMTYHAPQVRRAFKAWQRNYVSYRSYLPSDAATAAFPLQYGRMTEIQFNSYEAFQATRVNNVYGALTSYTPPPGGWRGNTLYETVTATIPVTPDELPVSEATPPKETPYLRWIIFIEYPESVSEKACDRWWKNTGEPAFTALSGLKRLALYHSARPSAPRMRVVEVWFDDMAAFEAAVLSGGDPFSPAAPWGEPLKVAPMMLIGENPDVDFVNDRRSVP